MQRGMETRGTEIRGTRGQGGLFEKASPKGARKGTWEGSKREKKKGEPTGIQTGTMYKVGLTKLVDTGRVFYFLDHIHFSEQRWDESKTQHMEAKCCTPELYPQPVLICDWSCVPFQEPRMRPSDELLLPRHLGAHSTFVLFCFVFFKNIIEKCVEEKDEGSLKNFKIRNNGLDWTCPSQGCHGNSILSLFMYMCQNAYKNKSLQHIMLPHWYML